MLEITPAGEILLLLFYGCPERTISNDVGLVRVDDLPAFSIIRDSLSRF
jgi:hypothetical protein